MSSAICQNFVQNAWKKELCSNCFKSKDEHAERPKPKPIVLVSNEHIDGIIKKSNKNKPKRSVCFTKELTEFIGYGGEDWDDGEESDSPVESSDEDFLAESEDEEFEKELKQLTKENTDYNTTNLQCDTTVKKTTQLLLGKPLVDSSGRKKTLMVSVTPFGEETPPGPKRFIKTISHIPSHIPISKSSNKDSVAETKQSNVVLTSYTKNENEIGTHTEEKSLLDEITETLENGKNPIQIISRKKGVKDTGIKITTDENNKENINKNEDISEGTNKVNSEKKVALTRTPALKRDHEKPFIYQTSTAKIEFSNSKSLKLTTFSSTNRYEKEKSETRPSEVSNTTNKTECISERNQNDLVLQNRTTDFPKSIFPQSREQAGEPDGRADPDNVVEPPALPLTPPPPLECQNSFLHNNDSIYEKPKIPTKSATVLLRKSLTSNQPTEAKNRISDDVIKDEEKILLCKQDSNGSDISSRLVNKRRAPKPPEDQTYSRNSLNLVKSDSPVIREKEKRERASSCTPKITGSQLDLSSIPEPAPRKLLSVSTDSLAEDKRKEKTKGRFSLKKFLRMGTSKELPKADIKYDDLTNCPTLPKPKLIIVHPTELNGSRVEVVPKLNVDQVDYQNIEITRYSNYNTQYENQETKAKKPPPPPRNLDDITNTKPNLPHPPKSSEILKKQKQLPSNSSSGKKIETVYANIGEIRSTIVPNKPQRTASMRENETQQKLQWKHSNTYEPITTNGMSNGENVYDYINSTRSSSPDSNSSPNKNSPFVKTVRLSKKSESSIDVSGDYFKFSSIPRSLSLTYCGSETESEIYSPYSLCGSEPEVTEDDNEWTQNGRTHKLRSRKGRSIVHKNLEDNYGAVIVANHEALAQVLENIQQVNHIQPALRGLKTLASLRWSDFSVTSTSSPLIVGGRTFQQAIWNSQHVTLLIYTGAVSSNTLALGTHSLTPVTEFSDLVPADLLCMENNDEDKLIQATIEVLPWTQVSTIYSYSEDHKEKRTQLQEDGWKQSCFILLQMVNALKMLQAQGIEELSLTLSNFILCKEVDKESHLRLCVLQGLGKDVHQKTDGHNLGTLCMCASKALSLIQPPTKTTSLLQSLLNNEKAVTLTQVKSILEFCLWGPSDVSLGSTIRERELALQRWLDLQRATVLHGLVCTKVQLTVYEECHLFFLVRSNARMMSDASLLFESSNKKNYIQNGHT